MTYKMIPTSKEVFAVIMARHKEQLRVFESYTNPDGRCPLGAGSPEVITAWGFSGCDFPILYAKSTWEIGEKEYERANEKHHYWLCVGTQEVTDE